MRGNQVEFLTKKLNLTPDQVTQVKAIDDDARKQMKALREDTSIAGAGQAGEDDGYSQGVAGQDSRPADG